MDVFYLITPKKSIFARWLELKHISMDFNCCLLSSLLRSPSLAMQEFRDVTAHAWIVQEYEKFWVVREILRV